MNNNLFRISSNSPNLFGVANNFFNQLFSGGSRAAATSKIEAVNYYHKALYLRCSSCPRFVSAIGVVLRNTVFIGLFFKALPSFSCPKNI